MPSKSPAQRRFMAAAANNADFAKRANISQSVARDFARHDGTYAAGGTVEGKRSKASVDYSHGMEGRYCRTCEHFEAPDGCTKVEGKIDGAMWCKLWQKARGGLERAVP